MDSNGEYHSAKVLKQQWYENTNNVTVLKVQSMRVVHYERGTFSTNNLFT